MFLILLFLPIIDLLLSFTKLKHPIDTVIASMFHFCQVINSVSHRLDNVDFYLFFFNVRWSNRQRDQRYT